MVREALGVLRSLPLVPSDCLSSLELHPKVLSPNLRTAKSQPILPVQGFRDMLRQNKSLLLSLKPRLQITLRGNSPQRRSVNIAAGISKIDAGICFEPDCFPLSCFETQSLALSPSQLYLLSRKSL
jgi:hypothetical protein